MSLFLFISLSFLVNIDNTVGAIGFLPLLLPWVLPIKLIKVDDETGEPIRDPKTGFVTQCLPNEAGELIGKIIKKDPLTSFDG